MKSGWLGAGAGFHPYGVDNIEWEAPPFIAVVRRHRVSVGTQTGGDLSSLMFSDDDRLESNRSESATSSAPRPLSTSARCVSARSRG